MSAARESQNQAPPPEYLVAGEIVAPFGVRGEVKVLLDTDFPELVLESEALYIGEPAVRYTVEWARPHQGMVRLKLAGCDDRDAAEALRGQWVQLRVADMPVPEEDEYYYYQLLGLRVWTEDLGTVADILTTGEHAVLIVRGTAGELLLPTIGSVIREVDLPAGKILVHLLEGLR
jgi:16S rRNA processing protein RimM